MCNGPKVNGKASTNARGKTGNRPSSASSRRRAGAVTSPASKVKLSETEHNKNGGNSNKNDDDKVEVSSYTLREHCDYLFLKTERSEKGMHWYCDWTNQFVSNVHSRNNDKVQMQGIVQDYCQPFMTLMEHQELVIGLQPLSIQQYHDPLPVRTMSIHLRPDAKQSVIMEAVQEAFHSLHPKHQCVLTSPAKTSTNKSGDNTKSSSLTHQFTAIGGDGNVPVALSATIGTNQTTLERRLWLKFYHMEQIYLNEEQLQEVGGISNQKAPLRNALTPMNTKLAEACVLVQYIMENSLSPKHPCPTNSSKETSKYLQTTYTPSASVLYFQKHFQNAAQPGEELEFPPDPIFPSLSQEDYAVFQESYPLVERIFSELELQKATYNTLINESSRFGMRPNQSTLDKHYCFSLSEISQQRMLLELQQHIQQNEDTLHNNLQDIIELQRFLMEVVMRRKYNIPIPESLKNPEDSYYQHQQPSSESTNPHHNLNTVLDIGQTPVALPRRDDAQFPWHDDVRKALDDVSELVARSCLEAFDANQSLNSCHDAIDRVFTALDIPNTVDQQSFLKSRNRQAMIKLAQQQTFVKSILAVIGAARVDWDSLPKLKQAMDVWNKASNFKISHVPLMEFTTKFGRGCLTHKQLIVTSKSLMSSTPKVQVLDLTDIQVVAASDSIESTKAAAMSGAALSQRMKRSSLTLLYKVLVLNHQGEMITGLNPTIDCNIPLLVKYIQILQSIQ